MARIMNEGLKATFLKELEDSKGKRCLASVSEAGVIREVQDPTRLHLKFPHEAVEVHSAQEGGVNVVEVVAVPGVATSDRSSATLSEPDAAS